MTANHSSRQDAKSVTDRPEGPTRDPVWAAHRANLLARDRAVSESAARRSDCQHLSHCKCWDRAKAEAFAVLDGLLQDGWTFTPPPTRQNTKPEATP